MQDQTDIVMFYMRSAFYCEQAQRKLGEILKKFFAKKIVFIPDPNLKQAAEAA